MRRVAAETVPLIAAIFLWAAWLLVFALRTVHMAPQLSNEAELMYEASRIARGLPLYTDPLKGAFDDGPLPIRHYVLYGPLAPWLLSLIAEPARLAVARSLAVAAWFIGLPAIACMGGRKYRLAALVVAFSYSGLFLLTRDVVYFTLTPIPMLLAAVALVRVVRKGTLDLGACLLFTLAWAIKPLVMGIALGVGVAVLFDRKSPLARRALSLGTLLLTLVVAIAVLIVTTNGAWLTHLQMSTGNGMLPRRWLQYATAYFPFLGLPHLAVAVWLLKQKEDRASTVSGWVLVTSTLWSIFAMGKRGANVGYFMEPCAALVVALAFAPQERAMALRPVFGWISRITLTLAPLVSFAISWPTLRAWSMKEAVTKDWARLVEVRSACEAAAPGGQIRAGLPPFELALSGRVTLAPWQHTVLVNNHAFPLEVLVTDLDRPELGCIVHTRGLEGPPPEETNEMGELTYFDVLFDVKLREPIRARFEEFAVVGGLHLFRRRAQPRAQ